MTDLSERAIEELGAALLKRRQDALAFVYEDGGLKVDDFAALAKVVRAEIEALAVYPPLYSKHAYRPRMGIHTAFANGAPKEPGTDFVLTAPRAMPLQMCAKMVACAAQLRGEIAGDVALVWRHEPEFDEQGNIYMRLCFEPIP